MSKWTPWNVCAHFDSIPNDESAKKGTLQHEKLCAYLNKDESLVLDATDPLDQAVKWAGDVINTHAKEEGVDVIYTEEKFTIEPHVSGELAGIYGSVDACFIKETNPREYVIHIFDFKALKRQTDCDLFPQLMGYALAVASTLDKEAFDLNMSVVLHVLRGGAFKEDILHTNLLNCIDTCEEIVNKRKHLTSQEYTSSSWCKYCVYSSSCESVRKQLKLVEAQGLKSIDVCHRLVLIDRLINVLEKAKEECKDEIANAPNKTIDAGDVAFTIKQSNGPSKIVAGSMASIYDMCVSSGATYEDFLKIAKCTKGDLVKLLASKAGVPLKSKDPNVVTAESMVAPYFTSSVVEKLERIK